jgi:hypothetical protein
MDIEEGVMVEQKDGRRPVFETQQMGWRCIHGTV